MNKPVPSPLLPIERNRSVPEVGPSWVAARLTPFRVVDVRETDEFDGPWGHIDGAELVPLGTLAAAAAAWPRDEKLVLVCRSGGRSGRAALLLESMDFEHVASMRGGMMLWREDLAKVGS
ncbi:MAG: sulfur dioxygenase [Polyangiales bacterium]|jgi:sulfur dioxygenase